MPTLLIHYHLNSNGIDEVIAAAQAAFAALQQRAPEGVRFTYGCRVGSNEFFALLDLDEGVDNPLATIGAARALQTAVGKWAVGRRPTPQPFQIIGSYGVG